MKRSSMAKFQAGFLNVIVVLILSTISIQTGLIYGDENSNPIVEDTTHFNEADGLVAVEAEHFFKQELTDKRAFYHTSSGQTPTFDMDGDPSHVGGASNGAYLEILPDTRRNHGEKLIGGTNFSNQPGKLAVVHYKVNITNPGRYYVWVRCHSTGSEDNGLHVGLDGDWPDSGRRMQWCEGKNQWFWESKQRTEKVHCGVPHQIFLDIEKPGIHTVHFSMREDGFEFDKWLMTTDRDFKRPQVAGPVSTSNAAKLPTFPLVQAPPLPAVPQPVADPAHKKQAPAQPTDQWEKKKQTNAEQDDRDRSTSPTKSVSNLPLIEPRQPDGDGSIRVSGEKKQWHKISLTMNGPFAHEQDNKPNPFLDIKMETRFVHSDGTSYVVPGYFAADGKASETSAESGNQWRTNFAPDRTGQWNYVVSIVSGDNAAIDPQAQTNPLYQSSGSFTVAESNKSGRDLRAHGRLKYVGKHYLQHMGSGKYFLKAGADAPETLFGYADFDGTFANKPKVPLKSFSAHLGDWAQGDPVWQGSKGKGLIGAISYLSSKGCNAFSFLTYNAGGDGDNVWPFVERNDKLHYDCSKLDQWDIVMDHATAKGMYLHFKMQETENDDHRRGSKKSNAWVPTCLDGGNLGQQRKLYIRELVARFGHNLALNWNIGEENTQSNEQQLAMIDYIRQTDPYDHHVVIHTYPDQQDAIYGGLAGDKSSLTGTSLQNSNIKDTHWQTVKWVRVSAKAGKPWVVAFDESGSAAHGQCPDWGYRGFDGKDGDGKYVYDQHSVRRQTLWGTIMGGGAGVEYYFGYKFAENDLLCEDWRSRDQSWDYCRICLEFFANNNIPFQDMKPMDELVGNEKMDNSKYCFAKPGEIYLVYLAKSGTFELDLSEDSGEFSVAWYNPRTGGDLSASASSVSGGGKVQISTEQTDGEDWLAVIRRK